MISFIKKIMKKLQSFFKRKIAIPSYEYKRAEIEKYKDLFNLETLIETGTFLGDTVAYFESKFKHIYSIELSEELANRAKNRFSGSKNVNIIQGDSGIILKDLMLQLTEPTLFWLDGHYSSEFFVGEEYIITAKAEVNTPILAELKFILNSPLNHIILIDDARLFVGEYDYPKIAEIRKLAEIYKKNYHTFVLNDIIYLVPNAKYATKAQK